MLGSWKLMALAEEHLPLFIYIHIEDMNIGACKARLHTFM